MIIWLLAVLLALLFLLFLGYRALGRRLLSRGPGWLRWAWWALPAGLLALLAWHIQQAFWPPEEF